MDAWNPVQYEHFKIERSRPFWDLAALVDFKGAGRLLDIGCGTGQLTHDLHLRENLKFTLGIDSSSNMLKSATDLRADGLHFARTSVEDLSVEQPFDVVISNAALQWVDHHRSLLPKILGWLRPGGQLAIQMPANFDHTSHQLADEIGNRFGLAPRAGPMLTMEDYARLMVECGAAEVEVFTKVYLHPMASGRAVVEWVKGTLLTHFEKQMSPPRFQEFMGEYTAELVRRLGEDAYLYTFKRLFVSARV